jgi:hypothetical protein
MSDTELESTDEPELEPTDDCVPKAASYVEFMLYDRKIIDIKPLCRLIKEYIECDHGVQLPKQLTYLT